MSNLSIEIQKNGSYSLCLGEMHISNAYPGIDGSSIRPLHVSVSRKEADWELEYQLEEGIIQLIFSERDETLYCYAKLLNFQALPQWFYPFYQAGVSKITGVYLTGFGMGGPSGFADYNRLSAEKTKLESFGNIALQGEHISLFFAVYKNERFIHQYNISFEEGNARFSAGFRLECIASSTLEMPVIQIFAQKDLHTGLTLTAEQTANQMQARGTKELAYHWCSWYYLYHNLSESILEEYLPAFKALSPSIPLKYIQIDAGYFQSHGDWLLPNKLWPHGMKAAFDLIRSFGYKPGIWIGPYMVGNRSELFKNHPDWILYDLHGIPIKEWIRYNEPKEWGYPDEEYYVLDTSHPDAMQYIRHCFRTLRKWGVELFKTDFLQWGIQDSTKVKRAVPGKTSIEYYRELMTAIREEIGEDCYWLGCIAPFLPSIGFVDGMRIGGDVGASWGSGDFGPDNMIREVVGSHYYNHIYWQNDPDAVMLRDFHIFLKEHEIEALALLQGLSGGTICTSDPLHQLSEARRELFRFIHPSFPVNPYYPFLGEARKELVLVHTLSAEKGQHLLFFFNNTLEDILQEYQLKELVGDTNLYLYIWNSKTPFQPIGNEFYLKIPKHGCKLYFTSNTPFTDSFAPRTLWDW
jgi:alpha-galactosidase